MTEIVPAGGNWAAMTFTLSGDMDYDNYVFGKLNALYWTSEQADNAWNYTDGYAFTLSAVATTLTANSIHCISKTAAADSNGSANGGAICFKTENGALRGLEYRSTVSSTTNLWTASNTADWATCAAANASKYRGFVDAPCDALKATETMNLKLYQPKWQYNDYYVNNFRVNRGDTIQAHYSYATATVSDSGATKTISAGATALAASAIALGSLMLSF